MGEVETKELPTPEELKRMNVLNLGMRDVRRLQIFSSLALSYQDVKLEDIELAENLLNQSLEWLANDDERDLLQSLLSKPGRNFDKIVKEKLEEHRNSDMCSTLFRNLGYITKVGTRKEARVLLRAYRAVK